MTVTVFEFGDFTLDLDRFELCRNGCRLKLERKPMELLILLAASKGSLVTRTEIAQRLWDSEVYVDTEHGINTAIRKIRQVLDDDPEEPRFVQTVTGKGYRFIGTLAEPPPTAEDEASDESAESNHTGDTQALASSAPVAFIPALTPAAANPEVPSENESWKFPRLGMLFWVAALGGLAALILVFSQSSRGFLSRFLHRQTQSPTGLKIASLAVLPLDNLSGDPRQEYFADGMTDELTTMLAKNSSLRIVSRTSVMQYKGVHRPLPEIARALGVDGVLEGSISRSGDKVHMTIQLIHAPSDTHLWAESYDRDRNDVASLPREAALTIAKRLNGAVLQSTPQRYVSPEAHDAYLRGRYYWFAGKNDKDIQYLKKAIELQPDYALGWSGLSAAYATGALNGAERPSNVLPLAEAAAMKALELDDSLAEAHDAMAEVYLYKWNWNQALKESTRSIELDPGNAEAYYFRSLIFMTMNRMDDALESVKKSTEIDPFTRPAGVAAMLIFMRNYEAAISAANTVLETVPNDSGLHQMLAEAYQCKGMEKEAIRETEKAMVIEGDPAGASALRRTFERGGYRAIYQSQLNDLKKKAASEYVAPMSFAEAYSNLRLKEETLHFLEEAYDERAPSLVWIQTWPELDFLRGDERYRSIIRRVGLPPAY